ncbi:MAG: hypothetical protein PHP44_14590 [Kiritimatiellae bacterium]|nr:hypothetical protein [Kiritimatiellia bacterium]
MDDSEKLKTKAFHYFKQLLWQVGAKVFADIIVALISAFLCTTFALGIVWLIGHYIGINKEPVLIVFGFLSLFYAAVILVTAIDRHRYFASVMRDRAKTSEQPTPEGK